MPENHLYQAETFNKLIPSTELCHNLRSPPASDKKSYTMENKLFYSNNWNAPRSLSVIMHNSETQWYLSDSPDRIPETVLRPPKLMTKVNQDTATGERTANSATRLRGYIQYQEMPLNSKG
ncbi:hypothetical protein G8764_04330 [Pseudomaricurvus alcaniphilus]|uniref:hypothetical protein n=1 Tax=Pseudomaricurvus alcaniphilus TaxID=1166482 RepID=UPI0014077793|nr:hypothetical protein [Pseudomaricurvus alcaniphilus]NHN36515.1 hypothetical protein [Pseudomaricurvus alcaniphilus]